MKQVLVLVGTPGVGKSSVARLLANRLEGIHVDVGALVKKEGLSHGVDETRDTLIADLKKVSRRVARILKEAGSVVIVEGHFAMEVVAADDVSLAFVLRRDPDELREALRARAFKEDKVAENVAAEILDVCLFDAVEAYGEGKVCEVDASGKTVAEVTNEIVGIVEGKKDCRVSVVDWLTKLELEGRLDEFLRAI